MNQIITVLIKNGYKDITSLAQTCREFLRTALSRDCLIDLINLSLQSNTKLSHFFYMSLPYYMIDMPYSINLNMNLRNCCVAGGYITRKLYNKKYVSDIDIWINNYDQINMDLSDMKDEITGIDIVIKSDLYSNISTSDLSICGQCVVYDNDGQ